MKNPPSISRPGRRVSKLANVRYSFEVKYFADKIRALRRAEDWGDQIAGLGNDFVAGHGILGSTANIVNATVKARTVRERDLQHSHAQRHEALEFFVGQKIDLGALTQCGGVFQPRTVVR